MAPPRMYYVSENGIVSGPFGLAELRVAFISGTISFAVRVRRDGHQEWLSPEQHFEFSDITDPAASSGLMTSPESPRALSRR